MLLIKHKRLNMVASATAVRTAALPASGRQWKRVDPERGLGWEFDSRVKRERELKKVATADGKKNIRLSCVIISKIAIIFPARNKI